MRPARWFPALLTALMVAACSDSGTGPEDPGPGDGDGNGDGDPTAETFCERLGYPCSTAEVSTEAMERGDGLLDDMMARIGSGESIAAAVAWLEGQDGVANVAALDNGFVFHVEGGPPIWYVETPIEAGGPPPSDLVVGTAQDVVGHGTARERPDHTKKAIVVAPFLFQFGSNDSGPALNGLIAAHREYAGRVTNRSQGTTPGIPTSTTSTGTVTVADFQGWTEYDVVVLSTHGGEMSEGDWGCGFWEIFDCIGAVATGERVQNCGAAFNTVVQAKYASLPGVRCGGAGNAPGKYIYLDTDFFAWEYPVGLDRAIIYFGACKSSSDLSTASRLAGSNSDFFGWDNNVIASEERASAMRLFQLMITNGLTTTEAFEQLDSEGRTSTSAADMLHHEADDGLHIREITNLKNPLHPSVSGPVPPMLATAASLVDSPSAMGVDEEGDLMPGDLLPFFGQAGDGQNDQVFFYVDVDGIRSGRESDYDVTVTINQQELGTFSLDGDDAERIDDYTVRVRIQQELDFDVQNNTSITLRATANLPGGDDQESYDEVSVTLANPQLHIHSTIESSGGEVDLLSEVQGEIDLNFEPGEDRDDLELAMSIGPLRYVRFEASVSQAGCTITAQTFDGRLSIREGDVSFEDPESGNFGVPDELVIFPLPEIRETLIISCAEGSFPLDFVHWFAGFSSFHGGGFGGPNELDQSRGGFVVTNWQQGSGDVYARKVYNRSGTEDDVTVMENTTLEIRGPNYAPTGAARARIPNR